MANAERAVTDEVVYGDFVLRQKIGEGGFGTVYLAEQRTLDRPAVVKVMRRSLSARPDAVDRFVLEARLASKLDHPCAAHIYAFGAEPDGTLWIAMELVKGTSLDTLLEKGPLSIDRVVPMMERLCEAVQTAHDQGIVHRDIKPANVMVAAKSGRLMPKLLDFGIAKQVVTSAYEEYAVTDVPAVRKKRATLQPAVSGTEHTVQLPGETKPSTHSSSSSLTQAGQILGSPPYMAPEQWVDPNLIGPWTDQYALALLAYEALTGERACIGTTLPDLAAQHIDEPLRATTMIPDAIFTVLARAAAKEPKDRYPELGAFVTALRAAAGWAPEAEETFAGLRVELRARWTEDAPRPIAESVVALAATRSPNRFSERSAFVGRVIARWLGALAIACKTSRTSRDADALRELRKRTPRDEEWIDLAASLVGDFDPPETCPIPELAVWLRDVDALDVLRQLVRGDGTLADGDITDRDRARRRLAMLEGVLETLDWMLDYEVGREVESGVELWSGSGDDERVVRRGPAGGDRVVVLDADGARVVSLSPLVVVAPPMAGAAEELFVLAGRARSGAPLYGSLSRGYEREDLATWAQLGGYLLDDASVEQATADERSPYPGLAAFTTNDHASFVGREREVSELVNRLRTNSIVAVVGPSGAGKSSFLAAGVIPALPGGWTAITIRPGRDPIATLEAICERFDASPYRDGHRKDDPTTDLGARLLDVAEHDAGTLVLVIDQLEELFTQGATEDQRAAFAGAILTLSTSTRARVVVGVRDDFLCRVEELAWRGVVSRSVQILGVPSRRDLERIVVEPARRHGYDFDDATLPAKMVDEVIDRHGALPLLSFAAAELWERRDRHFKRITKAAYTQIGGVSGALVQHADGVVDAMTVADRKLVRLAFRRLLTAEGARIVHGRAELVAALGETQAAMRVVERLLAARLVVSRDDDAGERIEIIHEALSRAWPRLEEWRREDASSAKLHEQLVAAARHWSERSRPDGLLWRDAALDELRRWRVANPVGLAPVEAEFADASDALGRRARRRKLALVSSAFVVLGSTVVVLAVTSQRISAQRAEAVRRVAAGFEERGRLAIENGENARALLYLAEAARLGEKGPVHDLLVGRAASAVEGFERVELRSAQPITFADWGKDAVLTYHDDGARRWDRSARRSTIVVEDVVASALVGDAIAALTPDGAVTLTAASGERWRTDRVHAPSGIVGVTASADGASIASVAGPDVHLWATADGASRGVLRHDAAVSVAEFDASNRRIATAAGGTVTIWDVATANVLATCATPAKRIPTVQFSRSGDRIVMTADDGVVRICDAATGEIRHTLAGHLNVATRIDLDDKTLISASLDGTARLWNLETGAPIGVLVGHRGGVRHVVLSPDGKLVATGGDDGTIRVWDVASAKPLGSLEGHGAHITGIAWDTQDRIETASFDGTVRSWNTRVAIAHAVDRRHDGAIDDIELSTDGKRVLTYARDRSARLWDTANWASRDVAPQPATVENAVLMPTGVLAATVDGRAQIDGASLPIENVAVVASSPDGRVATATADGAIHVWSSERVKVGAVAIGFTPGYLTFHASGRFLAAADTDGNAGVVVIDAIAAREVARFAANRTVRNALFDDTRMAILVDHDVELVDIATWQVTGKLAHRSWVTDIALASDGRVVTASNDSTLRVWDRAGRVLAQLPSGRASSLAVSADSDLLAVGASEGSVDVWDLAGYRKLVTMRGHRMAVTAVTLNRDASRVFSAGVDGRVASWDLRRSTRSAAGLAQLVKCRVPLRLDGEAVLPREIDFDDPACH